MIKRAIYTNWDTNNYWIRCHVDAKSEINSTCREINVSKDIFRNTILTHAKNVQL